MVAGLSSDLAALSAADVKFSGRFTEPINKKCQNLTLNSGYCV